MRMVPDATVKPMGIGSHFLPMEHPGIVLEEIREFFREEGQVDGS